MNNRQKILETAAEMFRTYGIRAVTMDMLANQLRISKRTIYEVFKDKDEILSGVLWWMTERQKTMIVKIFGESENVIEGIFRLFDVMNEHFHNMSPAFIFDIENYYADHMVKIMESDAQAGYSNNELMIRRGIEEGLFRNDLDIEITSKCLYEMLRMGYRKDFPSSEDKSRQEVLRDFYLNYLRGISTLKGLDLINHYNNKEPNLNRVGKVN
jgi:AcrR family transcriptional regulator